MLAIAAQDGILIQHYLDLEQYEKALPLLSEALANEPLQGKWHYLWAYVHYKLKRYQEVEPHYQEALRLGHSPVDTYFMLGLYYQVLERYGRAQGAFEEALRLQPHNAVVLAAFAYLKRLMNKKKEAKRLIEEAIRLSPGNPRVLNYYVNIQMRQSSKRKSMQAMQMRIQSGGSEKHRQVMMALYEFYRKRFFAAREHYRQAFLIDPLDRVVLNGLYRMNLLCHPLMAPLRFANRLGGPRLNLLFCMVLCLTLGIVALKLNIRWLVGVIPQLFLCYFLYLMIGGWIFKTMTSKNEKKNRESGQLHG